MTLGMTRPVNIEEEMRSSYLAYAMSVIVSRALPDVRDGLKPVHRRILYAMQDMGLASNSAHKKSARIVGEVLGKYHPHGDAPVYEAMVRMAQDFSMRYVLVDGQGNFGSMDDDPPAAMRYTEARLAAIAEEMLADIDRETVPFMPNFDDSLTEPVVLPTRVPNLLINGSSGIAVGMATNIPPHNLGEVCDAMCHLIDNPEATVEDLTRFVKGPDFPTGGIIQGVQGIKNAYATGHGRVVVRAKAEIHEDTKTRQIVVTEVPYQTNKAALVEKIAELVKDKKLSGISDLRDESDRQGLRVVVELKRDAQPEFVLAQLYQYTAMQSAFFINMLALVDGQPKVISLKEAIQFFIDFRQEVITRRSQFDLREAQARAHVLEGLKIALDHIDAIIKLIRESESAEAARGNLMTQFGLSQIQAQAILDMQLRRLANMERSRILNEYTEVIQKIAYLEDLLANPKKILFLIKEEANELKEKYGDPRRTEIAEEEVKEFRAEDLIPHQRVVVTLSSRGFIKRVPTRAYRIQHRGGKGIIGMTTREEDAVRLLTVADTHDNLLFFTNRGKVYRLKCYDISADSSRAAKGMAVVNLFPVAEGEKVTAILPISRFDENAYLIMATRLGEIKKTPLDKFAAVRSSGIIAMDLAPKDESVSVCLANDENDVILVTKGGMAIRFAVATLRTASRTSGGVRSVGLHPGDEVISMDVARPGDYLLMVTSIGFGKLSPVDDYSRQNRGGRGVKTIKVGDKTGEVTTAKVVSPSEQVMIMSAEGIVTRTPVKDPKEGIPVLHRQTKRVIRLMKLNPGDKVVALTSFDTREELKETPETEPKRGK
ncbi:MAG: DNA gyrase subunit A [Chloroflexi bacterium]|nr:DNA gyrase subunit A [Chloroflexota bacterium]